MTNHSKQESGDQPKGVIIAIAGPDGAGKSTVRDMVVQHLSAGRTVHAVHHRPHLLAGRKGSQSGNETPHAQPPYSVAISATKLLYVFTDYSLAWRFRYRKLLDQGDVIIIERPWGDMGVDPTRYRLTLPRSLFKWLGRRLPEPDLTLILEAPPEVIAGRKSELSEAEIRRQLTAWKEDTASQTRSAVINVEESIDRVRQQVVAQIEPLMSSDESTSAEMVALPSKRNWRLLLPKKPAKVSAKSLRLIYPTSTKGKVAYEVIRGLVRAGALRVIPAAQVPGDVHQALGSSSLPPATWSAVARANHPNRYLILRFDAKGDPTAFAKVGADSSSRDALRHEHESLIRFKEHLAPPLVVPGIRSYEEGALVLDWVNWKPRSRPWELPLDVARALGTFSLHATQDPKQRAAHGDFAPWNLVRAGRKWILLDWESANPAAPPYWDLSHFYVQSHTLLGRPSEQDIERGFRGLGSVGQILVAYAEGADVDPSLAMEHLVQYLKQSATTMDRNAKHYEKARRGRESLLRLLRRT